MDGAPIILGNSSFLRSVDRGAGDEGGEQFALSVDGDEVCGFARSDGSTTMIEAGHGGGIPREQTEAVFDSGSGELNKIGKRAIEREHAAGKNAASRRATILDLNRKSAELVLAIGHAGGGHCVGDEDAALRTFAPPPETHDVGPGVNAVADQLGVQLVVGEDGAENAGLLMIESTHGIKGVGGADCS